MVNKATLIGNLGKDPEIRNLESGAKVASFSIATNESYKDKSGERQTVTEWHNIVAWRGLADVAEMYLKKGHMVYIEGKITTRKWQDNNGNDRYTTDIVAQNLRLLERKNSGESSGYNKITSDDEKTFPKFDAPALDTSGSSSAPKLEVKEDDLPF